MSSSLNRSTRQFYIENLGCAKNQVDAEEMIRALADRGYTYADTPDSADIIIVNSCGFISSAKEESLETLLGFRAAYPGKKIILAGCLSQRYGEEMDLPEADGIFGNRNPSLISRVVEQVIEGERPVYIPQTFYTLEGRTHLLNFKGSAYLKIAEGCNNRCSFCAIPLIRGGVQSRSIEEIVAELKGLLSRGVFEINLIAQDLASYGIDRTPGGELISLLTACLAVPGDFWLRLLYIHPDRFPGDLIRLMKDDPRILPYFDLPFQHASPPILASMGRKNDPSANLARIDSIRSEFHHSIIRTTFLLGYPGETAKDVDALLDFQEKASFDWLGAFTYSREEGTRAYNLKGPGSRKVRDKEALRRKSLIEERQIPITGRRLDLLSGSSMRLLVEEDVEGEDLYICRGYPHAPEVDGAVVLHGTGYSPGDTVEARIIRRNGVDLEAVPLS